MFPFRAKIFSHPIPVATVIWILFALIICFGPIHQVVMRFIPDDGYYYLEIARRMGIGEGSTFDGITVTNGYHPLWLWCLLPLAKVMTASREIGLRLAILLGVALTGGAFLLLNALSGIRNSTHRWLFLLLPMSMLLVSSNYGMESPLVLLLLALWLFVIQQFVNRRSEFDSSLQKTLLFSAIMGFLSSALILARLDMALFVLCFDAFYAWTLLKPLFQHTIKATGYSALCHIWLPLTVCAGIQMVLIGSYLAYNFFVYGHFLTVSAIVKSGRMDSSRLSWLWASWGAIPGVASGMLALAAWIRTRQVQRDPVFTIAAAGTILSLLVIAATSRGEAYHWYFAAPIFLSGFFIDTLLSLFPFPRCLSYAKLACLILILGLFSLSIYRRTWHPDHRLPNRHYDSSKWIAQDAPTDAVFALPDCGLKAYFSERPHLNTDGLTCSFDFQESLRNGTVASFLTSAGVNMVYSKAPLPETVLLPIRKGMYGVAPHVQASIRLLDSENQTHFLWKITSIQMAP